MAADGSIAMSTHEEEQQEQPNPDRNRAIHDREGWSDYRRLVLDKLDTLSAKVDRVERDVVNLRIKAAAWGFVAGTGGAIVAAAMNFIANRGH